MPKRKYTNEERSRLGIDSPKYKKYDSRGPRIREEYIDLSEDKPRRRAAEEEQPEEFDAVGWIAAAAVALVIAGLIF